jgi:integrase
MVRRPGQLSPLQVTRAKARGYLSDGGNLYLQVSDAGAKSWVFRYRMNGRLREMGLGSALSVSLAEARIKALDWRKRLVEGIDPLALRRSDRDADRARAVTFKDAANTYVESRSYSWKNAKHAAQWPATLTAYAYPVIGDLLVRDVTKDHILKILEPIWRTKSETASRLRGRIEAVLDWAKGRNLRTGDNPAAWEGNLETDLVSKSKVHKVKHHEALAYKLMPEFMTELRAREGIAARALEFTVSCAARTSEVLGATWGEVDLKDKLWRVPGTRMKMGKDHEVPLSEAAIRILRQMLAGAEADAGTSRDMPVFWGQKPGKPLSQMSMLMTLRRMGRGDLTTHGFRATFRIWAAEQTNFPREVVEHALAHQLKDKVEQAYQRSTLFERRRELMAAWAQFLEIPANADVIPIKRPRTNS